MCLIVAVIGIPFILLYTAGVYYFFRGKTAGRLARVLTPSRGARARPRAGPPVSAPAPGDQAPRPRSLRCRRRLAQGSGRPPPRPWRRSGLRSRSAPPSPGRSWPRDRERTRRRWSPDLSPCCRALGAPRGRRGPGRAVGAAPRGDTRRRVTAHLADLGPAYAAGERSGEIASTLVDGLDAIEAWTRSFRPAAVLAVVVPVLVLGVVLVLDPLSALVLLVTGPVLVALLGLIGSRVGPRRPPGPPSCAGCRATSATCSAVSRRCEPTDGAGSRRVASARSACATATRRWRCSGPRSGEPRARVRRRRLDGPDRGRAEPAPDDGRHRVRDDARGARDRARVLPAAPAAGRRIPRGRRGARGRGRGSSRSWTRPDRAGRPAVVAARDDAAADAAADIVFERITVAYPGRPEPALADLDIVIAAGRRTVIVGPVRRRQVDRGAAPAAVHRPGHRTDHGGRRRARVDRRPGLAGRGRRTCPRRRTCSTARSPTTSGSPGPTRPCRRRRRGRARGRRRRVHRRPARRLRDAHRRGRSVSAAASASASPSRARSCAMRPRGPRRADRAPRSRRARRSSRRRSTPRRGPDGRRHQPSPGARRACRRVVELARGRRIR